MKKRKLQFTQRDVFQSYSPYYKKHFFNLFRGKGSGSVEVRPGAITPEEVKRAVQRIGYGKIVEILRIGYDGVVDDMPMIVELTHITREGFSGKIVNVERRIIEGSSQSMVYAKRGGGVVEFLYSDGDIKEIKESRDADELSDAREVTMIMELLMALEINDRILVAYYDEKHRGTVNVEGMLLSKSSGHRIFKMVIEKINGVELERKIERQFDIENDLVIDISLI